MISAPATGCCSASLASRASAGGQLEQPSDVNNSKTTGTRTLALLPLLAVCWGAPAWHVAARIKARAGGRKCDRFFIRANSSTHCTLHILRFFTFGGRILDSGPCKILVARVYPSAYS